MTVLTMCKGTPRSTLARVRCLQVLGKKRFRLVRIIWMRLTIGLEPRCLHREGPQRSPLAKPSHYACCLLVGDPTDTLTSSLWLPVSDVIVCDDKIVNVDDGDTV